jgi:hypothetical protein
MNPIAIVPVAIKAIADAWNKRQDRKIAKESATAKLKEAKQSQNYNVEMKDQEWEAIAIEQTGSSWKDEYVTVSMFSIVNLIVIGGMESAIRGEDAFVLNGVSIAIQALIAAGVDVGTLLNAVAYAAIGLTIWRRV